MASVSHEISTPSTVNGTSYASGAFTPSAGDLLVVFVTASGTVAAGSMTDSQSLGFTLVTSAAFGGGASTVYCFVSNAFAAASAMTVTFDCTGDAATGAIIQVAAVTGAGDVGASAAVQSAGQSNQSIGIPAATFGAAVNANNATLACVGAEADNPAGATPPIGWTELDDTGYATPATGAEYCARDSGFSGTTITWGSAPPSVIFADVAVEILAAAAEDQLMLAMGMLGTGRV